MIRWAGQPSSFQVPGPFPVSKVESVVHVEEAGFWLHL